MKRIALRITLLGAAIASAGCAGGGRLAVHSSLDPNIILTGNFTTGVYSFDDENNLDLILLEGPENAPTQAVHLRMHWRPIAGKTPVDERATNATVRYMIFTGEAAGVYEGAGFLFPKSRPGASTFRGELRNTALRLLDSTANFNDRLGLAVATGGFSARRDNLETFRTLKVVQSYLRQQLNYPRFVDQIRTPRELLARMTNDQIPMTR